MASFDAVDEQTPFQYFLEKLKPYVKVAKLIASLFIRSQQLSVEVALARREMSDDLVKASKNIFPGWYDSKLI